MKKVWLVLLIYISMQGCRDVIDIRSERGKGQRRDYHYAKSVVFKVAKEALISLGFALGEINESEGFLSGTTPSEGILGFKSGEIVGIWITGNGPYSQVEIAWLRRSLLDPAARDWTTQIFKIIDEKLGALNSK
ncbi:MAG: hypothetical protein ACK4NF_01870 [Planctomycetota bacterium]